jgi:uncharacterized Zn finger protein
MKANCPKCGGTEFEVESYTREHLVNTLELICCSSCGGVVGGTLYTIDQQEDIMIALEDLRHRVDGLRNR